MAAFVSGVSKPHSVRPQIALNTLKALLDMERSERVMAVVEDPSLLDFVPGLIEQLEDYEADLLIANNTTVRLKEQLEARDELLRRLRQWDMLNQYIGGVDGLPCEPTADAPYWRGEIDRVLSNPASSPPEHTHGPFAGPYSGCPACVLAISPKGDA